MLAILQFLNSWRELITKVFTEHTLAGAVVTIGALWLVYELHQKRLLGHMYVRLVYVFIGWAIITPIVGFVMTVLGEIWSILEATIPFVATIVGSLYRIYEHHPYMVLLIIVLAGIIYFVWERWWKHVVPHRFLKVLCILMGIVVAAHLASPIADLIAPSTAISSPPSKEEPIKSPQPISGSQQ